MATSAQAVADLTPVAACAPTFTVLQTGGFSTAEVKQRMRINCFGSMYYFIKNALGRYRLTSSLHEPLCLQLESDHIKDVIEMPRDHFKSTIGSEGFPMWRVLPFGDADEDYLTKLGYADEYIFYMRRMHRPASRNLLVSENITNSSKLGIRISSHYESNAVFRSLFPEILPDTACRWSQYSLQQMLPGGKHTSHGEGTFDFLGVGGALQSRHYDGLLVQDDLVGRKAIESTSVMDKTIDYHRLVCGAFEGGDKNHDNDELVIGNRWSYLDLNSYIAENEPFFKITTHGARGGCCDRHPANQLIFPEEWSMEKLERWRKRLGNYNFSCQFLNDPAAPENTDFREEWLRYYELAPAKDESKFLDSKIIHSVENGEVKPNLSLRHLQIGLAVDPNHSGNASVGRCRHAIMAVGLSGEGDFYLLASWAKASPYEELVAEIYNLCDKFHLRKFGLETVAAQKYLAFYLDYRAKLEGRRLEVVPLKGEVQNADGTITRNKEFRIRNTLGPIFETRRFWVEKTAYSFMDEYRRFPSGKFVDQMDALAYIPQLLRMPYSHGNIEKFRALNHRRSDYVNQSYGVNYN
jgi:hypothetical protein